MGIAVTTKFKIAKPANEVFEALVDPAHMANYWFSSGSARWEPGKRITLRYDEYDAQGEIQVIEVQTNRKIVFQWVAPGEPHVVTITLEELDHASATIEVTEIGWKADEDALIDALLDNKGGWVYMLTCLKGYLEFGVTQLRAGMVR
jgi:uncharacterized protein YndB with AHSA1/START domain